MNRNVILKCTKDFHREEGATFTEGETYLGMIRFMASVEDGKINKAIRVKDDNNNRIYIYEQEDSDVLKEHFIVLIDK